MHGLNVFKPTLLFRSHEAIVFIQQAISLPFLPLSICAIVIVIITVIAPTVVIASVITTIVIGVVATVVLLVAIIPVIVREVVVVMVDSTRRPSIVHHHPDMVGTASPEVRMLLGHVHSHLLLLHHILVAVRVHGVAGVVVVVTSVIDRLSGEGVESNWWWWLMMLLLLMMMMLLLLLLLLQLVVLRWYDASH